MPRHARYDKHQVEDLRKKGFSWDQIATHYQVSKPSVWRWYHKQLGPAQQTLQTTRTIEQAELIDTRTWPWDKWALQYLGIELDQFQLVALKHLDEYLRIIYNFPRRHGKTTILLRIFVTRKLCETVFTHQDESFIYVSANKDFVVDFVLLIASDLIDNDRIVENYGFLLEEESVSEYRRVKKVKRKARRQTQMALNLGNRKDLFNHSLLGTTIKGAIRGKGATRVLIDDPMDEFHGVDTARKETKKILRFIKEKIYPISIGLIAIVGTRYDVTGYDIFTMLAQELEGRVWKHISKAAVLKFGSYQVAETARELLPSDIIIDDESEWQLLSRFIWDLRAQQLRDQGTVCTGLQLLVYYYHITEKYYFQKEWQNNVAALLSTLKWEWLQPYARLPYRATEYKWAVFVDEGAGESSASDYTAMVLVGVYKRSNDFFIHDFIYGRWTGKQKLQKLEDFIKHSSEILSIDNFKITERDIACLIETVLNQRDLFQRTRDESHLTPIPVTPTKRGQKENRIIYGLGQEMENSKVYLNVNCRNQMQLRTEIEGFPASSDDHAIDALDQAIYHLKTKKATVKAGWF